MRHQIVTLLICGLSSLLNMPYASAAQITCNLTTIDKVTSLGTGTSENEAILNAKNQCKGCNFDLTKKDDYGLTTDYLFIRCLNESQKMVYSQTGYKIWSQNAEDRQIAQFAKDDVEFKFDEKFLSGDGTVFVNAYMETPTHVYALDLLNFSDGNYACQQAGFAYGKTYRTANLGDLVRSAGKRQPNKRMGFMRGGVPVDESEILWWSANDSWTLGSADIICYKK